jgi:hypothetical protein
MGPQLILKATQLFLKKKKHVLPPPQSLSPWIHRTIRMERPQFVGEVSVNFADRGMSRGHRDGSLGP